MVSMDDDLDWEEQEIDRAFDLSNMIFGAALSAYIGVVLAKEEIATEQVWVLAIILVSLTLFLSNARRLAHCLRGTHDGPLWAIILGLFGSLVAIAILTMRAGLRGDLALAVGVAWIMTLTFLLGSQIARRFLEGTK